MRVDFKKRLKEINFFISQIPEELPSHENEQAIKSNIRASIVLLCSHFEGVLKDIIESFIYELNDLSLICNNIPTITYAKSLIGKNEETLKDINNLVKILDEYRIDLDNSNTFFLDSKKFNNTESNPTPEVIIKLFKAFGFENIIDDLNDKHLQIKAQEEHVNFLREEEKKLLLNKIQDESIIEFINKILAKSRDKKKPQHKYGYYESINSLLVARHTIVHGNSEYKLSQYEVKKLKKQIFNFLMGIYKELNLKKVEFCQ